MSGLAPPLEVSRPLERLREKASRWAELHRAHESRDVLVAVAEPMPPIEKEAAPRKGGQRARTYKDIAGAEELELVRRYQAGDRAAGGVLLQAHHPAIARWAHKTSKWSQIDYEECLQEACIGFLHAVSIYDFTRGATLITMARPWIRQRVAQYAQDNARLIRIPVGQQAAYWKEARGETYTHVIRGKSYVIRANEQTKRLWSVHLPSLDAPVGDEEGMTLGAVLPDLAENQEEQAAAAEAQARRERVLQTALERLPERERRIIQGRYLSDEPCTLEEIGTALGGLSRERARQIETVALARLRQVLADVLTDEDADALFDGWGDQEEPVQDVPPPARVGKRGPPPSIRLQSQPLCVPPPPRHRPSAEAILANRPLRPPQVISRSE